MRVLTFSGKGAAKSAERRAFAMLRDWYVLEHNMIVNDDGIVVDSQGKIILTAASSVNKSRASAGRLPGKWYLSDISYMPEPLRSKAESEVGGTSINRPREWEEKNF